MFISLIGSGCDQSLCKCSQGALRYPSEWGRDVVRACNCSPPPSLGRDVLKEP